MSNSLLRSAAEQAQAAATAANVRIETIDDHQRLDAVAELFARVWEAGQSPIAPDVLRAVAHSGGAVHVAYGTNGPVGATAAIFGPPADAQVYSLIAAARDSGRGVGFALKQAQRAWALGHGATAIAWTFDPLIRRNARFNLVRLGAVGREYLVDFYGPLDDGVNGGDETDRLTVVWPLTPAPSPKSGTPLRTDAERRSRGARLPAPTALGNPASPRWTMPAADGVNGRYVDGPAAPDGKPLLMRDAGGLWCRVPPDIVAVRQEDPATAARWRTAVREVFVPAFVGGLTATSVTDDGWYRLEAR